MKTFSRHITIPVFLPQMACPHQCVFCDQSKISGSGAIPSEEQVRQKIEQHLQTIDSASCTVEIGFFGGSFTGLAPDSQRKYLEIAESFCQQSGVHGIRLSTRPDLIDNKALELLSEYSVRTIELGAQSFDDEVLKLAGRGHTAQDIRRSSELIRSRGFRLGLQMMIGLPGDTLEKAAHSAQEIASLNAQDARLYPALVIKDTPLAELYQRGFYQPLTLEQAILWSKDVLGVLEEARVKIIRVGLHPGSELQSGQSLLAGPFHPAFRELVNTELWNDLLMPLIAETNRSIDPRTLIIHTAPDQLNPAAGYQGKNRKLLEKHFNKTRFIPDPALSGRMFHAVYH